MITQSKIDKAISLLQKAERIALKYSDKGFYLAFSGGKDSQCIYHLAKMAGVKSEAHYNMTTVDPPEVVHFIRDKYPEVIIDRPPATMWQIIEKHNMLPTKSIRYCCQELKESKGGGWLIL